MKKILLLLFIFCFSLTGCSDNSTDTQNNDYTVSKTTTNNNEFNTNVTKTNIETNNTVANNIMPTTLDETELSSFSTKLYTPNDTARQNNIRITCSKLDGTIVKAR